MRGGYVLGMDIGGTNVRLGMVDSHFGLTGFCRGNTREVFAGGDPIGGLSDLVEEYVRGTAGGEPPLALSLGFPSTIDKARRTVLSTPNIPGLQNLPVADLLEERFSLPVYLNRDVNFLILFDMMQLKIPPEDIVIGCYFGTGLGNAICLHGELLTGKNGVAAELGHIPVLGSADKCPCGNTGCIEVYASGRRLERIAAEHFPQVPLPEIFTRCGDRPEIREFVDYLAVATAVEVNLLDPDWVVLGGGVLQMKDFPRGFLEERILERARKPYPGANLRILYSREAQENGVVGAGIYAYGQLKKAGGLKDDSFGQRPCGIGAKAASYAVS